MYDRLHHHLNQLADEVERAMNSPDEKQACSSSRAHILNKCRQEAERAFDPLDKETRKRGCG